MGYLIKYALITINVHDRILIQNKHLIVYFRHFHLSGRRHVIDAKLEIEHYPLNVDVVVQYVHQQ